MFGRRKNSPEPATPVVEKQGGKGRPTPTRKEAEAAARARAKPPRTRREVAAAQRKLATSESSARVRQGMRNGEEKYLLPRDQGPVRRFLRDLVDARFSVAEVMMPLLVVSMILTYSGNPSLASIASTALLTALLVTLVDFFFLSRKARREVEKRFPDASPKGNTWYVVVRALQIRFLRLPKPQVKIGQTLPTSYR